MRQLQRIPCLLAAGVLLTGSMTLFAQSGSGQSGQSQSGQAGQSGSSQSGSSQSGQADRQTATTTMTGCLNKDTSGGYTLTDETTGTKTTVTVSTSGSAGGSGSTGATGSAGGSTGGSMGGSASSDLEKHSANHRVTLTGTAKTASSGTPGFEVIRVQHISDTCKAPGHD